MGQTMIHAYARDKYGKTGIHLKAGQRFKLDVIGDQVWNDGLVTCSPGGWDSWFYNLADFLKVLPGQPYMRLLWCVRSGSKMGELAPVDLNGPTEYIAEKDGELCLVANENRFLYWTNTGIININVEVL